jgi:hypothetical protein
LFAAVAVAGVISSCGNSGDEPGGGGLALSLAGGKNTIMADGVDAVTFVVKLDGVDVTGDAVVKQVGGENLPGATFTATTAGTYRFTASYDGKTSNEVTVTVTASATSLVISTVSDKHTVLDDGVDAVTFVVKLNGQDVTSSSTITQDGQPFTGTTFSSMIPSTYKFQATHNGETSNELTITVGDGQPKLLLLADKSELVGDGKDKATFTVWYGKEDVTAQSQLLKDKVALAGGTTTFVAPVISNPYSLVLSETHRFEAKYNNMTSPRWDILVNDQPLLEIRGDKYYVDANETVTFTVNRGDVDVTSQCNFRVVDGSDLSGRTFSSATYGEYEIEAYTRAYVANNPNYRVSGKAKVKVSPPMMGEETFDAGKTIHKNLAFFNITGAWCAPCLTSKNNIKALGVEKNNHIVIVSIYESGQYEPAQSDPRLTDPTIYADVKSQLTGRFGTLGGYPSYYTEFETTGGNWTPSVMYDSYIGNAPKTAIKVSPSVSGNTVNFTVTVGAQQADTYSIQALLMEDNVVAIQGVLSNYAGFYGNFNHTNVFRDKAVASLFGEELGAMTVGQEKTWTKSINIKPNYNKEQLSLVVYTLYKKNGNNVIANTVKVPLDRVTGYVYGE